MNVTSQDVFTGYATFYLTEINEILHKNSACKEHSSEAAAADA